MKLRNGANLGRMAQKCIFLLSLPSLFYFHGNNGDSEDGLKDSISSFSFSGIYTERSRVGVIVT